MLIRCPDCQTEVSDQAVACPKCGYPIQNLQKPTPSGGIQIASPPLKHNKSSAGYPSSLSQPVPNSLVAAGCLTAVIASVCLYIASKTPVFGLLVVLGVVAFAIYQLRAKKAGKWIVVTLIVAVITLGVSIEGIIKGRRVAKRKAEQAVVDARIQKEKQEAQKKADEMLTKAKEAVFGKQISKAIDILNHARLVPLADTTRIDTLLKECKVYLKYESKLRSILIQMSDKEFATFLKNGIVPDYQYFENPDLQKMFVQKVQKVDKSESARMRKAEITRLKKEGEEQDRIRQQQAEEREASLYQLEISNWSWGDSYGYATATGQVRNTSGESLRNVQAVVSFYDRNGTFITSADALIDYNPILPGQSSPFKVMERYNPAMNNATLEFKYFSGGAITSRMKPKKR